MLCPAKAHTSLLLTTIWQSVTLNGWARFITSWACRSVPFSNQPNAEKQAAYQADITYGTNNEYGFDYLRDNMEYDVNARRQRGLFFAIVDEVDSILIDEARTPLIISGPAEGKTDVYVQIDKIPDQLTRQKEEKGEGDYWVDEKAHTVQLSEAGHEKVEAIMSRMGLLPEGQSLYSPSEHHASPLSQCSIESSYNLYQKISTTSFRTVKSLSLTNLPAV